MAGSQIVSCHISSTRQTKNDIKIIYFQKRIAIRHDFDYNKNTIAIENRIG